MEVARLFECIVDGVGNLRLERLLAKYDAESVSGEAFVIYDKRLASCPT